MSDLKTLLKDLVVANRILAHEGVVDAYGHVSIRHPDRPDRFFLSGSRSPELVMLDDIIEFDLDCNPIDQRGRPISKWRSMASAIGSRLSIDSSCAAIITRPMWIWRDGI